MEKCRTQPNQPSFGFKRMFGPVGFTTAVLLTNLVLDYFPGAGITCYTAIFLMNSLFSMGCLINGYMVYTGLKFNHKGEIRNESIMEKLKNTLSFQMLFFPNNYSRYGNSLWCLPELYLSVSERYWRTKHDYWNQFCNKWNSYNVSLFFWSTDDNRITWHLEFPFSVVFQLFCLVFSNVLPPKSLVTTFPSNTSWSWLWTFHDFMHSSYQRLF